MILKLAKGKREAGQKDWEEGFPSGRSRLCKDTEVAPVRGEGASGPQRLDSGGEAGAERPPRARSQGPAWTVLMCDFSKLPCLWASEEKQVVSWDLGAGGYCCYFLPGLLGSGPTVGQVPEYGTVPG